jgi:hypothetical protein
MGVGAGGEEPIIASYKKLERKPNVHGVNL